MRAMPKATSVQINIEPGLFEWTQMYETLPKWMSASELQRLGMPMNVAYQPLVTTQQLYREYVRETADAHMQRVINVIT